MHRHRHRQRNRHFQRRGGMQRAPVLGGHHRLRQLRQFNFGFQYMEGESTLRLVVPLPGIDKESLKVRAKGDLVSISAKVKEELEKYAVRPEDNWDIALMQEVVADSAKAKYSDGILLVDFDLANPAQDVEIEVS